MLYFRWMKLSLVIPVFNEQDVLPITLPRLRTTLASIDWDYEILFVDDGSRDRSFEMLSAEAAADPRMRVLSFSRNFGHQLAVTAGLDFASGDAVIIMDADLQDPPELIPEMLRLYEAGYDVVSPQRISREGDSWMKRKTAAMFYSVMKNMVDRRIPKEVGDFRLLSRAAVVALRGLREQHRFVRGMIAWLGLREAVLPFQRQTRAAGTTKYPFWKMVRFSWTAISSFSAMPLRLTMGIGFVACLLAFLYLAYALFLTVTVQRVVWGWTSIVFLQCFLFGITLICIGLIGDYVARVYEEAKDRPLYVIGQTVNLHAQSTLHRSIVIEARHRTEASDR